MSADKIVIIVLIVLFTVGGLFLNYRSSKSEKDTAVKK
jgi:flagellar basal body-associated protein FliL